MADELDIDFEGLFDDASFDDAPPASLDFLTEEDVDQLPTYDLQPRSQTRYQWFVDILKNTSEGFKAEGCGEWLSVTAFPHNRVTPSEVQNFQAQIRSRMSEIRRQAGSVKPFYVVVIASRIMPDRRRVVWRIARMTEDLFSEYRRMSNNVKVTGVSVIQQGADFLRQEQEPN